MNPLDAYDLAAAHLGPASPLANTLTALRLCDGVDEVTWATLAHLLADETRLLDGLRAGDGKALLPHELTEDLTAEDAEWSVRITTLGARRVLLRYSAEKLHDAGHSMDDAHDYEGPDRLLVLSMLVELDRFARGEHPPARPIRYRELLDA